MKPEECWKNLAIAVIDLAVDDRKKANETLRTEPDDADALETVNETDRFFRSRWFEELLDLSGIEEDADSIREQMYDI